MITVDGTWAPGKYLYLDGTAFDSNRYIIYGNKTRCDDEFMLHVNFMPPFIPPSRTTGYEHAHYSSPKWRAAWITRNEVEALVDMVRAQAAMEGA